MTSSQNLFRGLFLLICLSLLATPALAQKGSFEVGLDLGTIDFDEDYGGDNELAAGLRLAYYFTDKFALEYQRMGATSVFDLTMSLNLLNAVFFFGERDGLYGSLGAGTSKVTIDILPFNQIFNTSIDDTGTALKAGLGYRFGLGKSHRRGIRLEAFGLAVDAFDVDATHFGLTAGFGYRFGG